MSKYFKPTGRNLFCNDFVVESALQHTGSFLKELDQVFDFESLFQEKLIEVYKGRATLGAPMYRPEMLLKMLFLSYLFNVSEREIERVANDSISMKAFLHLSLEEACPDHSSLTRFKDRMLRYRSIRGRDIFREIFDRIILEAQKKGIDLGYTQVIDSTHTVANVNTDKDRARQKSEKDGGEDKGPRDPDSTWGVKKILKVKTVSGEKVKIPQYYFGYKSHLSGNSVTNLITSYCVSGMHAYDGAYFEPLMRDDLRKGVSVRGKTGYAADRMYDDGDLHAWLNQERLKDGINLKYVKDGDRTVEGKVKARFTRFTTQKEFEETSGERYAIERINASCKKDIGLGRSRYLGLMKMEIQTSMTALCHNLKTLVRHFTGVPLRTPSCVHVS